MIIKTKLIAVLCGLLLILGGFIWFQHKSITDLNKSLRIEANNYKAQVNKNRVYQYNLDELRTSNQTSDKKVDSLMKVLKIKPKKVVETIYVESDFKKSDTIILKDTLFLRDDSCEVGDKWYNINIKFQKPNIVLPKIRINNKLICIVSDKRETIKPRKKFFISRWFQRKQTVQVINIKELNPYSTVQDFKFINYIK